MDIVRKLVIARGGQRPAGFESRNVSADDVWPEVSSHYSEEELARSARENSPKRVFFEASMILFIASLMAAVAAQWATVLS
ncbi:MAG: hypothetical protein V4559_09955 [Pseudomonadota bacterium]